ncbi:uncharacterized protein PHACADRAFT_180263 [Phanerochaete carnosa HHB-10118-sp]|uniref:Uncharacterized protein n=1 Tax=Phanerochaete carnosa (strain HHB-10118-sp) TaxID=650164 RepID=K5WNT4_PHACS|nr:uncharacterized protein PHACADRAFT_180263 [Phanerochaete carnosa HHB-10118-sp]EKM61115.1 hypothetical protein PHACADRAFT_180263 [Phanerochaete carnosa HHB-10118-sp]
MKIAGPGRLPTRRENERRWKSEKKIKSEAYQKKLTHTQNICRLRQKLTKASEVGMKASQSAPVLTGQRSKTCRLKRMLRNNIPSVFTSPLAQNPLGNDVASEGRSAAHFQRYPMPTTPERVRETVSSSFAEFVEWDHSDVELDLEDFGVPSGRALSRRNLQDNAAQLESLPGLLLPGLTDDDDGGHEYSLSMDQHNISLGSPMSSHLRLPALPLPADLPWFDRLDSATQPSDNAPDDSVGSSDPGCSFPLPDLSMQSAPGLDFAADDPFSDATLPIGTLPSLSAASETVLQSSELPSRYPPGLLCFNETIRSLADISTSQANCSASLRESLVAAAAKPVVHTAGPTLDPFPTLITTTSLSNIHQTRRLGEMLATSVSATCNRRTLATCANGLHAVSSQSFATSSSSRSVAPGSWPSREPKAASLQLYDPTDRCMILVQCLEKKLAQSASKVRFDNVDLEMQPVTNGLEHGITVESGESWSVAQHFRCFVKSFAVAFLSPWRFLLSLL